MFHKTSGGNYAEQGSKAAYTFPKGAVFELDGVKIPLEGITIECFYGRFHDVSTEHFTNVSSLLQPQKFNTYNTSIYIDDNCISGTGYPGRDDFSKYGIEYLTLDELKIYAHKVLSEKLPTDNLDKINNFIFKEWPEDNRRRLSSEIQGIQGILNKNIKFPKDLSIIYTDRLSKHSTHIVLSFKSHSKCVLQIDNTLSPLITFCTSELPSIANKINPHECLEKVSGDQARFIELYEADPSKKSFHKVELRVPVNKLFIQNVYNRMVEMLKKLDLPITDIKIHHSSYNQKNTDGCVTYAIQNKLNYVTGNQCKLTETVKQSSIRLRAEHAILSYLLSEKNDIPHFDEQMIIDFGLKFDINSWYPNFPEVCLKLDNSIKNLSFKELSRLYKGIDIDETNKLATKFTDLILSAMKAKLPNDEYVSNTNTEIDQGRAEFMERTMAPEIFYNNENKSLFISKAFMFSIKRQEGVNGDKTQCDVESTIEEKIVKCAFS